MSRAAGGVGSKALCFSGLPGRRVWAVSVAAGCLAAGRGQFCFEAGGAACQHTQQQTPPPCKPDPRNNRRSTTRLRRPSPVPRAGHCKGSGLDQAGPTHPRESGAAVEARDSQVSQAHYIQRQAGGACCFGAGRGGRGLITDNTPFHQTRPTRFMPMIDGNVGIESLTIQFPYTVYPGHFMVRRLLPGPICISSVRFSQLPPKHPHANTLASVSCLLPFDSHHIRCTGARVERHPLQPGGQRVGERCADRKQRHGGLLLVSRVFGGGDG